jgi:putative heme-binding domain-containing protein
MPKIWFRKAAGSVWLLGVGLFLTSGGRGQADPPAREPLILHLQMREAINRPADSPNAPSGFEVKEKLLKCDPARTAIIICDMWNQHWCRGATRRVGELAPAMNRAVAAARARGVLIIHAPSSCMDAYKDHPARKRAQTAPTAANLPTDISGWCDKIPAEEKGVYPIDQSDGGCDDGPTCPQGSPWRKQVAAIEIRDEDAISDSGVEIWNLLESRGIDNLLLMGVHTNMCVLGRPFGLRQLVRHGKNAILVRDLTDTMYNSRSWPFVSHHKGTERIVEHIEKYVAPTITSTDLTGEPRFQFQPDDRPRAVFVIGEDEYKTEKTLPEFARKELEPRGIRCTFAIADPKTPHDFAGVEALNDADLLVLSVRRRAPTEQQMAIIRRYIEAGKPVVGIRTACHAFDTRGHAPAGHAEWKTFDPDVLGGHYTNHHGNNFKPIIESIVMKEPSPILEGVTTPFTGQGSLYKVSPLASSAIPLLVGKIAGQPPEPVAWINHKGNARIFYTSLGHPGDFELVPFRNLLRNAILWALDRRPPQAAAARTGAAPPSNKDARSPLHPAEALASFRVPDDLRLDLVLAEPIVRQPVSMSFDERGRLWVVQYLQYPNPAGLKMVSHDGVWRAVYDKVPPPPPHHFPGKDKITIHEDTDGDGVYDRHKTFVDGLNIATAVAHGRGGVWVLNPPYLLFYPDANRDDVPDGDPVVHLRGFGLEDTHSVVNSLRWGPDGWLYAAQGSTVTGHITRSGLDDGKEPVHSMGQLIWRYHPETRRYEVFAEGGGNAFGVEIDATGRIYSGHNGGDTRGFHYVQGGYYQKGFNKHGPLSNPYAFGYFPAMKHDRVPRFTHTFVFYEADVFPARYRGLLFGVAPLLNHVVMSERLPDGSSFRTRDVGLAVSSSDPWFRPVDIKLGPDGALYIADWYDRQVNHYRNHEGQIDPASGRIYRLSAKGNHPPRKTEDLAALDSTQLVDRLADSNKWTRQTVLRLIGDRKDAAIAPALKRRLQDKNVPGQLALESLWALNLVGKLDERTALKALEHADPHVRLWTARLVCDPLNISLATVEGLVWRAMKEPDVEVRSQLACSARRLPTMESQLIVWALLAAADDSGDIHMPLLLWWAVEAQTRIDPDLVVEWLKNRTWWSRPIVRSTLLERLMRRFAASGTRADLDRCTRLLAMAPGPEDVKRLMVGFEAAYAGRSLAGVPDSLTDALAKYSRQSLTIGLRQGKPEAVTEAIRLLGDDRADRAKVLQVLQVIGEVRRPSAMPSVLRLAGHSSDNALRAAALSALAAYDDPVIATEVLAAYPNMSDDVQSAAQGLLAIRRTWAARFVEAVEDRSIDKQTVAREVVEKLVVLGDADLTQRVSRLFGSVRPATSADLRAEVDRLAAVVRSGSGVPKPGKLLFDRNCARCHTLFSKGGKVGPDLTTYRRDDLDTMLLNIVNPSAEVREGFATSIVAMSDGRVLTGVVVEQDKNVVVLRIDDGRELTIARDEIDAIKASPKSIMPEGLFKGLGEQEIRDLFAYLRSTQPLID